jgi:hypothetical protein
MPNHHQILLRQPEAAPKPEPGSPCNGCGVCCLLEPCPLGKLLSDRRYGACAVLRWVEEIRQYRCGALCDPQGVLQAVLPRPAQGLKPWLTPILVRLASRWIATGLGCDSTVRVANMIDN